MQHYCHTSDVTKCTQFLKQINSVAGHGFVTFSSTTTLKYISINCQIVFVKPANVLLQFYWRNALFRELVRHLQCTLICTNLPMQVADSINGPIQFVQMSVWILFFFYKIFCAKFTSRCQANAILPLLLMQ